MEDLADTVAALQRRMDILEEENSRLRHHIASRPALGHDASRRQLLVGGVGALGALAGSALLGRGDPVFAAVAESTPPRSLGLQITLPAVRLQHDHWVNYDWHFGSHFTGEQPPVVVASALDDFMEHSLAAYCSCGVAVHGTSGAYTATIMVRNVSKLATVVTINAVALGH